MERFAIKIDHRVKLNLYNICRLCGIDNPHKIPIIDDDVIIIAIDDIDEEPSLCRKILECVGVKVESYDKMPQSVCNLCADKINDFFEYKEMCKATNIQTRKLLGLPPEAPPVIINMKEEKQEEEPVIIKRKKKRVKVEPKLEDIDTKPSKNLVTKTSRTYITQRGKKQKKQLLSNNSKKVSKIKDEADLLAFKEPNKRERERERQGTSRTRQKRKDVVYEESLNADLVPSKKAKVEPCLLPIICTVCSKGFSLPTDFNAHIFRYHTPNILEYGCLACREAFFDIEELQDHQTWHKISNTPYICFKCNTSFERMTGYSRHLVNSCVPEYNFNLVDNIVCDLCNKEYLTKNLYDWHNCFIKPNSKCKKCNRHFYKKVLLFKHVVACDGETYVKPVQIKPVSKAGRKPKRTEFNLQITHRSDKCIVKTEPGSIIEIENETQIRVPSSQINGPEESALESPEAEKDNNDLQQNEMVPIVRIKQEPTDSHEIQAPMVSLPLTVMIKQEVLRTDYGDVDENILRNIKKEPLVAKPTLKIKIKKEHGTLNSTFVDTDMANAEVSALELQRKHKNKNKIYKIPKQLAMIIKQEMKDRDEHIDEENDEMQVPVITQILSENHEDNNHDLLSNDLSFSVYESSNSYQNNHENDTTLPIITDVSTVRHQLPLITEVTTLNTKNLEIAQSGIRVKMEFNFSEASNNEDCHNFNEMECNEDAEEPNIENILENSVNDNELNVENDTKDVRNKIDDSYLRIQEKINVSTTTPEVQIKLNEEENKQTERELINENVDNTNDTSTGKDYETIYTKILDSEKPIFQIENEEHENSQSKIQMKSVDEFIANANTMKLISEKEKDKEESNLLKKQLDKLEEFVIKTHVGDDKANSQTLIEPVKEQTQTHNSLDEQNNQSEVQICNEDECYQLETQLNICDALIDNTNENHKVLGSEDEVKASKNIPVQNNFELNAQDNSNQSNVQLNNLDLENTTDSCSLQDSNEKQDTAVICNDENSNKNLESLMVVNEINSIDLLKEDQVQEENINQIKGNSLSINEIDSIVEVQEKDNEVKEGNINEQAKLEELNSCLTTKIYGDKYTTDLTKELLLQNDNVISDKKDIVDTLTNIINIEAINKSNDVLKSATFNSVNLDSEDVSEDCLDDVINFEKSDINNSSNENEIDSDLEKELLEELEAAKKET